MITAHDIANAYAQAISAYWRGDNDGDLSRLSAWIDQFWTDRLYEAVDAPTTASPHAAGGHGIHWYEAGTVIVGCVPGRQGCYRIPRISKLPTETSSSPKSATLSQDWKQRSGTSASRAGSLRAQPFGIRH